MRPCQLCGATSWGPVSSGESIFIPDWDCGPLAKDFYLRCDVCKSIAQKIYVEISDRGPNLGAFESSSPQDPISALMASFKSTLPAPETRTERLLRAMLASIDVKNPNFVEPENIVAYIRNLERELDAHAEEKRAERLGVFAELFYGDNLLHRGFADRDEFEHWLMRGLISAVRKYETGSNSPNMIYWRALTKCFVNWLEAGAPLE